MVLQVREGNFGKDEATCRSLTELTQLTAAAYSIRARSEVYECWEAQVVGSLSFDAIRGDSKASTSTFW
jgi:hypothetical protein